MNKKNIILLLLLSMVITLSDGLAGSQRPRTFCESAELVTGVLRGPAVMAAHIAKLKASPTQARLFKMFANSIRLANQLLSIKNKPNDAHHYDICWSAHDIAMTLCDCLVLFEQKNQTSYNEDDDIPFDDDDIAPERVESKAQDVKPEFNLKMGTAFIYTTILPAIEGFCATYSAYLNTQDEVKNKRTALKAITSLSRCLSGVLGTSKDSSLRTVYLYALVANIAAALYEFSQFTDIKPNGPTIPVECPICQAAFVDGEHVVGLVCDPSRKSGTHYYHQDCIDYWMSAGQAGSGKCPVCRHDIRRGTSRVNVVYHAPEEVPAPPISPVPPTLSRGTPTAHGPTHSHAPSTAHTGSFPPPPPPPPPSLPAPISPCTICMDDSHPATRVVCAHGHRMCEGCYAQHRLPRSSGAEWNIAPEGAAVPHIVPIGGHVDNTICPFCRGPLSGL